MLTLKLQSPSDLLNKLDREAWRALHQRDYIHKADHLYNFCITAHALKDYFFEAKGIAGKGFEELRKPYHDKWSSFPALIAASEIGNSSKHLTLRDTRTKEIKIPQTKGVAEKGAHVVHFFMDHEGELHPKEERDFPDLTLELSDGNSLELYQFTTVVKRYWEDFFKQEGVVYIPQAPEKMIEPPINSAPPKESQ